MRSKTPFAGKRNNRLRRLGAIVLPAVFLVTMLSQTVFARTYVITDGERVVTHTSYATDPAEVLDEAGLALKARDTDTTEGGSSITVNRARTVTVRYHGEALEASASGETVEALLARLELPVGSGDVLSHPLETAVYDGMTLCVDSVLCRQETYTATLAHEVIRCQDASIPVGMEEVLVQGRDGEVLRTADVTYINGTEVQRHVLTEKVTIAPVTQIVAVGTGEVPTAQDPDAMPVIGDGYIILPTGEVLTYTGMDTVRATAYTHTDAGCDMITATGSVVHWGTVAVDPRYIPYGTRMFIVASDGSYIYGIAEAEDCGGDIKGDRMDLYMPTFAQCIEFGRRVCTVYFLGEE